MGRSKGPALVFPAQGLLCLDGSLGSRVLPGLEWTALEASGLSLGRFPGGKLGQGYSLSWGQNKNAPQPCQRPLHQNSKESRPGNWGGFGRVTFSASVFIPFKI